MARFTGINQRPKRLADEVYEQLLNGILGGVIAPGERLVQEALASELGVSRTPVREALLRLEREGIIQPAEKRGFVIVEYTLQKALDTYQARQAVEGFAAKTVAELDDTATVDLLRPILTTDITVAGFTQTLDANRDAHRAVVDATNNEALVELFDTLWEKAMMLRIRSDVWFDPTHVHSHKEIFDAIERGDGNGAHDAMVSHLQEGLEIHMDAATKREGASS